MTLYRTDIDGLRAIAVLAVVAFHLSISKFSGGFVGVDVFFVISGFLITRIVWQSLEDRRFSALEFYARRIKRLFPALFAMLLICSAIIAFIGIPSDVKDFGFGSIASVFYVSNFYFFSVSDYFNESLSFNALLHTWSLSVEEQFYLFLPLTLLIIHRIMPGRIAFLLSALFLLSLAGSMLMLPYSESLAFFASPSRFWQFLTGSLIVFVSLEPQSYKRLLPILGWLALAVLLLSFHKIDEDMTYPGWTAIIPTLATAVLILAGTHQSSSLYHFLSNRIFRFFSRISYSLYLWHWPVIVFYKMSFSTALDEQDMIILFAISVLAAYLSWRFIEEPIRHMDTLGNIRKIYLAAGAASLLMITIATVFVFTNGLEQRYSEKQLHILSFIDYQAPSSISTRANCFRRDIEHYFDKDTCINIKNDRPNILLLGDSHAAQYADALRDNFPAVNVSQLNVPGCRTLLPVKKSPNCHDLMTFALEQVVTDNRYDAIILGGRWRQSELPKLQKAVEHLKNHTDRIIILGPVVEYSLSLPRILAQTDDDAAIIKFQDPKIAKLDQDMAKFAQSLLIEYVPIFQTLCNAQRCQTVTGNNTPVQFDYGHLTYEGAFWLIEEQKKKGLAF